MFGYQTGDLVRAVVKTGKKTGTYVGRVAVRSTGYFNIKARKVTTQGINHASCSLLQRTDGYSYSYIQEATKIAQKGMRAGAR